MFLFVEQTQLQVKGTHDSRTGQSERRTDTDIFSLMTMFLFSLSNPSAVEQLLYLPSCMM